jgi:DNA-directed RNA polymerase specialized sigma24 family protein
MDKLSTLAKQHKEWVKIVNSFGEYFLADDIVQETYIKIIRLNYIDKIVTETINKNIMWLILRSVYVDHLRSNKIKSVCIEDNINLSYDEFDLEKHEAFNTIEQKIQDEVYSWHWYDIKLFNLYRESKLSMRQIADETNISLTSIFNTLSNCKERLRHSIGEDFADYLNGEYELIDNSEATKKRMKETQEEITKLEEL